MAADSSIKVIPGTNRRGTTNGRSQTYKNYNTSGRRPSGNRNSASARRRRRKNRRRRAMVKFAIMLLFALIVLLVAVVWLENSRVKKSVTVDAGTQVSVKNFLNMEDKGAYFTADSDDVVTGDTFVAEQPGEYSVSIKTGLFVHKATLIIEDKTAPEFTVKNLETYTNLNDTKIEASDFVVDSSDQTNLTFTYETEPDFTKEGTQNVVIVGTDAAGNSAKQEATLTLTVDTEAPTITGSDFEAFIGDTISYKNQVSVSDNLDENPEITVDNSAVDTANEGSYEVAYTVTDAAGNSASLTLTMTLKAHAYSEDSVYALCDDILGQIITSDMSKYDQCKAIYNWIHEHIGYVNSSEKGDWVKSAYEGISTGSGDCYVYASVSKALLTRAGIKNMDISKIPVGDSEHYWNLVDIEDGHGWYHFDATPRVGHPNLFMLTNDELMEYSNSHDKSHNYDPSQYPEIP